MLLLIAVVVSCLLSACNEQKGQDEITPPPIEYVLNVVGTSTGEVEVNAPHTSLTLVGDAKVNFAAKSDTINVLEQIAKYAKVVKEGQSDSIALDVPCLDTILNDSTKSAKDDVRAIAATINTLFPISISSKTGSYDVYIKGYIREPKTGIILSVDRHLVYPSAK